MDHTTLLELRDFASVSRPGGRAYRLPQTGRVDVGTAGNRHCSNPATCRYFLSGAAQESNLPTVGLPRPAGFEDATYLAV